MAKQKLESDAGEVQYAELQGATKSAWRALNRKRQEQVLSLPFVRRLQNSQIFFDKPYSEDFVRPLLTPLLVALTGSADVAFGSSTQLLKRRSAERLQAMLEEPERFKKLSFGVDVAERDADLLQYFVSTKAFSRTDSGSASVIIGPKGSGKTAILRALQSKRGANNSIVITPEVFATSMLRQIVEANNGLRDEEQAFVSTWIFTILIEVFKRVAADPRGVPAPALKQLRTFLRDNSQYGEVDLFTRFIGYLKRIEGVKVGSYELSIKTRMLQELYSLAPLYEIVPKLRGAGGEILILLDELDQGWDNTPHANRFIGSLLKAAIKIQGFGLKAHVVTFLRSEIFDLIKGQLDQLDKLRSSIETLKWSDGELADLIVRRIAHSLTFSENRTGFEVDVAESLFDGQYSGMSGFEYLLSRTSLRPREVLQFLTHAHRIAVDSGDAKITPDIMYKAEEDFSAWKLDHICSEYTHILPGLNELLWSFRARGPVLTEEQAISIVQDYKATFVESLPKWANVSPMEILQLLFSIEFLGVPRPSPSKHRSGVIANYEFAFERRAGNIRSASMFLIQPATWSVLEIANS